MRRRPPKAYYADTRRCVVNPLSKTVGLTLISPGYEELSAEAVLRFKHFTGCDVVALHVEKEPAFFSKLMFAELLMPRRYVFFDADLWINAPVDFDGLDSHKFWGVMEYGAHQKGCFVYDDCKRFEIPPDKYFNTGLLAFDFRNELHRKVFSLAGKLAMLSQTGGFPVPVDRTEQTFINIALEVLEVERGFLPFAYNYFDFAVEHFNAPMLERVIGYHAAGLQLVDKMDHLIDNVGKLQCQNKST